MITAKQAQEMTVSASLSIDEIEVGIRDFTQTGRYFRWFKPGEISAEAQAELTAQGFQLQIEPNAGVRVGWELSKTT